MNYLLDADVFIRAKNSHYGFDFCPAFWDWLLAKNTTKKVFSIEKVGDELKAGDDQLANWSQQRGDEFFLKPDQKLLSSFRTVNEWMGSQGYHQSAISDFMNSADYYLIAHAYNRSFAVVTHEVPSGSRGKIKIPDVCVGLEIKCISPFIMLRTEKAQFVLQASS